MISTFSGEKLVHFVQEDLERYTQQFLEAFRAFADWLTIRLDQWPKLKVYHYGACECCIFLFLLSLSSVYLFPHM